MATRPAEEPVENFHLVHDDLTLTAALKVKSSEELERLSTNPHALLLLIHKYLNTEEARPFLLSWEVEAAMVEFCGVPESVRRTAGLLVLVRRFYDSRGYPSEDSVPR